MVEMSSSTPDVIVPTEAEVNSAVQVSCDAAHETWPFLSACLEGKESPIPVAW